MGFELAIIGVGNIGCRHIQAILGSGYEVNIRAVEPSAENRRRCSEVLGRDAEKVFYEDSLDTLPTSIDLAVIATTAKVRRQVVAALLERVTVRYLVIEKVMFQTVDDCLWALNLFKEKNVGVWVNFPRRMQPIYQNIRATLFEAQNTPMTISVTGSDWNMASNAVHLLDLVLYLSGSPTLTIEKFDVQSIRASKHVDCLEFTGSILGSTGLSQRFSINSWASANMPFQVTIESPDNRWVVREVDSKTVTMHAGVVNHWEWESWVDDHFYQSQLSGKFVGSLMKEGSCELAGYEEAMISHLPFLRAWNQYFSPALDPDLTSCQLT